MNKLLKEILSVALPIALGVFVFYWVYRDFDFARVGDVLLHGTSWGWMLLSLFFGVMSHVFRGWRWKQTLAPLGAYPRAGNCVDAIFVSYATNLVLPRVGEVSRCGVLARYDGVSFAKSLGTVVTERLLDGVCILLITGGTFLLQMPVFVRFFNETGTKIPSLLHLLASPWFYVSLFSVIGVGVLLYYLLRMLSFYEKVKGVVRGVWEGIMSLRQVDHIGLFTFYTVAIWACCRVGDVRGRHVCGHCPHAQWGRPLALRGDHHDDALWRERCRRVDVCPDCAWHTDVAGHRAGRVRVASCDVGKLLFLKLAPFPKSS